MQPIFVCLPLVNRNFPNFSPPKFMNVCMYAFGNIHSKSLLFFTFTPQICWLKFPISSCQQSRHKLTWILEMETYTHHTQTQTHRHRHRHTHTHTHRHTHTHTHILNHFYLNLLAESECFDPGLIDRYLPMKTCDIT